MRAALVLLLAGALAGCAQLRGHVRLVDGLRQFDAGEHDAAAKTLAAALEIGLRDADRAQAHKHLAFIHCAANRERQCREEFRLALAANPELRLDPAEASHPVWGPVFLTMSPGFALATGLKQYEEGQYEESAKNLQTAIERGLPEKQRVRAHKYLAFMHCASNRERQCRDEFRKALAIDPAFDLDPAESGHPTWGPIFQSLKTRK